MRSAAAGECVVVAGASGAVGSAIVRRLRATTGLLAVAVARDPHKLAQLTRDDSEIIGCAIDIGAADAEEHLRAAIPCPVRMLVQAVGLPATGPLESVDPDDLGRVVALKLGGLLRMIRAVGDRWAEGARIVAIGGHYGAEPSPRTCAAGVTNAALANLMRQLADDYGPRGVTVHLVAPGPLDSERLNNLAAGVAAARGVALEAVLNEYRSHSPLNRLGTLEEVAWAVEQLLSPLAAALHGSTLSLDGGARRGVN